MAVVPKSWMPDCEMDLIIAHWTGGGYKAGSLDRQHYHILIESNGDLVRGFHEISDNVNTGDKDYAAHTLNCNTRAIGISVCCMAGAHPSPLKVGKFPMTQTQWLKMAEVAADLAAFYGIEVSPKTVLGHGEVESNLNIDQDGKWDPMVLPWKTKSSYKEVGNLFRSQVSAAMKGVAAAGGASVASGEVLPTATALVNGSPLGRVIFVNEEVLFLAAELGATPGWTLTDGGNGTLTASVGPHSFALATDRLAPDGGVEETFVSAREIAFALDGMLSFDPDRKVVGLNWG